MRCLYLTRKTAARLTTTVALAVAIACPSWANAQIVLKTQYAPGVTQKQKQVVTLNQSLSLNGQNIDTAANQTIVSKQEQGAADAEGKVPVAIKIESLVASISLPGGMTLQFDSAKPDAKAGNPLLEPVLDAIRKQFKTEVKYSVDKLNKVGPVEGIQEGSQLDPASLQADLQQELERFPTEAISPGHTWERTEKINVGGGQTFTVKRKYEYVGSTPLQPTVPDGTKVEKITFTDQEISLSIDPTKGIPAEVKKSELKPEKSGGTLLLDNARGVIVSTDAELNVTGNLELSIQNQPLAAQLKLNMKNKTTVE